MVAQKDYAKRAARLPGVTSAEKQRAFSAALRNLFKEMQYINYIKPHFVSGIMRRQPDVDWSFVREAYRPSRTVWKRPVKWGWYKLKLDILTSGSVFIMATKQGTLEERLGRSPAGLWHNEF